MFYGDKTELDKCHEELNKLCDKDGGRFSCVHETENVVVHGEWIEYIEELEEDDDSFRMDTNSKWYGNPVYWHDWVKTNFPKLSVAFMCEEPGCGVFEKVDPDNKFGDYIYVHGSDIPDEDIAKLPQVLKDAIDEYGIWGTFSKDEVFNSEFQPSDLPDSVKYKEYTNTTYDEIRADDEAYLARWKEKEAY
jgi:hypothetical protein